MNSQISIFISRAPKEQKEVMEIVRKLIHDTVEGVQEEFKWSRPVFKRGGDFAYFKTAKSHVTIGFYNFYKLDDPDNLLQGSGKLLRHVKVEKPEDLDLELLKKWFIQASE